MAMSSGPARRWLQHPLAWALLAGLAVLVAAFAPVLWRMAAPPGGGAGELPPPWAIARDERGRVHALGLVLPGATLADAQRLWGADLRVALVESRGQPLALEAYTERWSGGGVNGKLVLATAPPAASLARWRAAATRQETVSADSRRWALPEAEREAGLSAPVVGLSFLPASRLDRATLQARFGAPAEVRAGEGGTEHWLYPERGLAMAWHEASGKVVLQVVAPGDFETRLRAPLRSLARAP